MHFCRIRGHHPDLDLYLDGRRLSVLKFLTDALPRRHIFVALGAFVPALWTLSVPWRTAPEVLIVEPSCCYRSFIRSQLDYGCEVYLSLRRVRLAVVGLNLLHWYPFGH